MTIEEVAAGDIAAAALKNTLLAEFGAKLQEGEARDLIRDAAQGCVSPAKELLAAWDLSRHGMEPDRWGH